MAYFRAHRRPTGSGRSHRLHLHNPLVISGVVGESARSWRCATQSSKQRAFREGNKGRVPCAFTPSNLPVAPQDNETWFHYFREQIT